MYAAYLASCAHLDAETAVEGLLTRWREIRTGLVVRPVISIQASLTALRYAGEVLGMPGVNLKGLPTALMEDLFYPGARFANRFAAGSW